MNRKTWISLIFAALVVPVEQATADTYLGFGDKYVAQKGDLNGDGRMDLHVRYQPPVAIISVDDLTVPIAHWDPVGDFVLQQTVSGGFTIVSSLSSSQKAAVASWPTAAVNILLGDFNVDGLMDLLLGNVVSVIAGAQDVFIFAPLTQGAAPTVARSWDGTLDLFLRDIAGWIQNPQHYYDPGLYYACQPALVWVQVQHTDIFGNVWYEWELRQVSQCGYYLDATNYSVPALNFLNQFIVSLSYGDMPPGLADTVSVSQQFQQMFGISLMRGTLESGTYNFGLFGELEDVLGSCTGDASEVCYSFFDRLKLARFFFELVRNTALKFCAPQGSPHHYTQTDKVCNAGSPGCSLSNVYLTEMLVHPVTGYWGRSHSDPFENGEKGYAEMGCTGAVFGACDPLYLMNRGADHIGIFDGGPIQVFRFDNEAQPRHRNVTLPGHVFHEGWIDRKAQTAPGGGVQIFTEGSGDGQCPSINELGGRYLFWTLDRFIECHLAGGCDPVP